MRLRDLKTAARLEGEVKEATNKGLPVKAKKRRRIRSLRLAGAKPFVFCSDRELAARLTEGPRKPIPMLMKWRHRRWAR